MAKKKKPKKVKEKKVVIWSCVQEKEYKIEDAIIKDVRGDAVLCDTDKSPLILIEK